MNLQVSSPQLLKRLKAAFKENTLSLGTTLVMSFLVLMIVLSIGVVPEHASWEVGTVATKDLEADRSVTYEDTRATEIRKEEVLRNFQDTYVINLEQFNKLTLVAIDNRFEALKAILFPTGDNAAKTDDWKREQLRSELSLEFSDEAWESILTYDQNHIELLYAQAVAISSDVMGVGVKAADLSHAEDNILKRITEYGVFSATDAHLLSQIMSKMTYYPTMVVDAPASQAERDRLVGSVEPVRHTIQKGQIVINRGDVISPSQFDAIKALDYTSNSSVFVIELGLAIVVMLLLYILYAYLRYFLMSVNMPKWRLWYQIVVSIISITAITFPILLSIQISSDIDITSQVGFMIPISAAAMLVSILIGGRVAVVTLMLLSLLLGVYSDNIYFVIAAIVGGVSGIVQTKRLNKRSDLKMAAIYISMSVAVTVIAHGFIVGASMKAILVGVLFAFANGFLSVVFTIGLLPFMESTFGITTSITLLELADPSNPLLKRLMHEAPGTYHHSLFVANLAESAATEIGANGLLARTAAYYHDIGKLKRPEFFSENQFGNDNPHDKITPMLSTLIITAHVKDGVAMAREHKLPEDIIDCIAQHHGNTSVAYFYAKACEINDSNEEVKEEDFRYHQKKPQTREAALLLMADTVEAAVRSAANKLSSGQIEGFIRQLILKKQKDGQFEECELTFKDLTKTAEVFSRIMCGIYHKRVEYPDQNLLVKQLKHDKGAVNADSH